MHVMIHFIPPMRTSSQVMMLRGELFLFLLFVVDKKREKKLEIWRSRSYFAFVLLYVLLWLCNNLDIYDIMDLGL